MRHLLIHGIVILTSVFFLFTCGTGKSYHVKDHVNSKGTHFALTDLEIAIESTKNDTRETFHFSIDISLDTTLLAAQDFEIRIKDKTVLVIGGDEVGAMYGILDLAEQIKFNGLNGIIETSQSPFIKKRGIKFNIPLDARLPSYDDTGDAAQQNIAEMWDEEFWHEYLDQLARDRYNVLTLWTKHPFPALIKLKDYPDVAMNDVYIFNQPITPETEKDWNGIDIQDTANLKLVKKMNIDEKISFWQHVMQYAHDRGIDIYVFTWNAFVTGAEKYGINTNNETGVTYIRECVREFVKTYPHVKGIGVTAGERMSYRIAGRTKEKWLYDTYGLGVQDAVQDNPDRKVDFVFRSHSTFLESIEKDFSSAYPFPVETDYKYSAARMYSSTDPRFFGGKFEAETQKYGIKSWMNVRNDDIFCFRWGSPDFAREYMQNMGKHDIAGFYMGSDGYVWGREFTSKNPALAGELEVNKHWYREMMWGRLAYNPELTKDFFLAALSHRFPEVDATSLYQVWETSSKIIPLLQSFHFKPADSQWHVEGCVGMDGFATIRDFIDCPTINPKEIMDIPTYTKALLANELDERLTPVDIGDSLLILSQLCLKESKFTQNPSANVEEFVETIADIEAMAHLGAYYGWKIKGTVAYYLYENDPDPLKKEGYKASALEYLTNAQNSWQQYADNADGRYKTQLLARTTYLDWLQIGKETQKDIAIVAASDGTKTRLIKLFVNNKRNLEDKEFDPIKQYIKDAGGIAETYPFSHIDSYAEYYARIVVFAESENDKQIKRMKRDGAKIPDSYVSNGYAVVKHKDIYWVMGKDKTRMLKAIDELVKKTPRL